MATAKGFGKLIRAIKDVETAHKELVLELKERAERAEVECSEMTIKYEQLREKLEGGQS